MDRLIKNPFTTIPTAARKLGVTIQTARKAIDEHLVPAGNLEEVTGQQRHRRYRATAILRTHEP